MLVSESVGQKRRSGRPHVYELDLLRVVTAFGVVAVHTIAGTIVFTQAQVAIILQHAAEGTMHFTREVFMFTTALVLVYTYAGKRFNLGAFWRKRGIGVVVPYAIWSAMFLALAGLLTSPQRFMTTWVTDLLTGDASYQLYYILLTIQFYLLFPLVLWLLPLFDRYPWRTLIISAALQLLILAVHFYVIQRPPVADIAAGAWMIKYLARLAPVYQFYFVLGAVCALRLDRLRTFALRHGRLIALAFVGALFLYWGNYAYGVGVAHEDPEYAISVLQPVMLFYSLGVIGFLWWVASRWAKRAGYGQRPIGGRVWRLLADASFGVYLMHPLFITFALTHSALVAPTEAPEPLRVLAVWLLAVIGSSLVSILLLRTPILSRLVGRSTPFPPAIIAFFASVGDSLARRIGLPATGIGHIAGKADNTAPGACMADPRLDAERRELEPTRIERTI
jgi:peptidoglycan/LPS O-acetylase OafA/YrhL